ncbi:hypothetical protein [Pseudonocardia sp. D17]|uniref:hypothetical protein n=1 Tax=Pseudonocardia sp. D17 TaxID=882661 RepID=UPI002B36D5E8|nr:hypothetical protein PSD17_55310 [Pseudonocardia sp. D17]
MAEVTTARDVIAMLRRHYLPEGRQPSGIFAPEIQAPTSTRRADLIWQDVTIAGKGQLVGHEVKVSRADVLAELADPMKADAWMRYCDAWWLVLSDAALIDGVDVPELWGVMAPPSGRRTRSMTIVRPAPRLKPADKAPAFETIAKWTFWRLHRLDLAQQSQARTEENLRRQIDDLLARVPRSSPHQDKLDATVRQIIRGLGGIERDGKIGRWTNEVDVDDVVAALRDLGTLHYRAQHVEYRIRDAVDKLESLIKGIDGKAVTEFADAYQALRDRASAPAEGAA